MIATSGDRELPATTSAIARIVAPVVTTSSTITMGTCPSSWKARRRECRRERLARLRALSPCCFDETLPREGPSTAPGRRRTMCRARSRIWSSPRRTRACQLEGAGTTMWARPGSTTRSSARSKAGAKTSGARWKHPPFFHARRRLRRRPSYLPSDHTGTRGVKRSSSSTIPVSSSAVPDSVAIWRTSQRSSTRCGTALSTTARQGLHTRTPDSPHGHTRGDTSPQVCDDTLRTAPSTSSMTNLMPPSDPRRWTKRRVCHATVENYPLGRTRSARAF